jgi:hypothetical protein
MDEIKTLYSFEKLLYETIRETELLKKDYQDYTIFNNIHQQLLFVKSILIDERRKPDFLEIESTSIGAIALKNLDEEMPEYSKKLKEISYIFCEYEQFDFFKDLKQ